MNVLLHQHSLQVQILALLQLRLGFNFAVGDELQGVLVLSHLINFLHKEPLNLLERKSVGI